MKTQSKKESDFTQRLSDVRTFWLFKLGILAPNDIPARLRPEIDTATTIVYFMTEELSRDACRRKGCLHLADEAWSKTYDALSKADFRGDSLLSTYTFSIARNETITLLGKELKHPCVEVEDDLPTPCRVLEVMFEEENMAHLLAGRPEMQKHIIRTVVGYEDDRKGKNAILSDQKTKQRLVSMGYKPRQVEHAWKKLKKALAEEHHLDTNAGIRKPKPVENSQAGSTLEPVD